MRSKQKPLNGTPTLHDVGDVFATVVSLIFVQKNIKWITVVTTCIKLRGETML
jgi:hypothetical protein